MERQFFRGFKETAQIITFIKNAAPSQELKEQISATIALNLVFWVDKGLSGKHRRKGSPWQKYKTRVIRRAGY